MRSDQLGVNFLKRERKFIVYYKLCGARPLVSGNENMIIVVYFCLCFLVVACQCKDVTDNEGFSNDSPYLLEPKVEIIRIKVGTPITLKCVHRGTWEYKQCEPTYKGILCNTQGITDVDTTDSWKRLRIKERLEIESSNMGHSGLYRCIQKGTVKKSIIVEVIGPANYDGPPPSIASLKLSNITDQLNMEFTIQCNVTSVIPPTIIWFKKCYGLKCDIKYDNTCYCHINPSMTEYNVGNTYISKINILNARDIDSGLYACLAVTEYGKDYKNVIINVPTENLKKENNGPFSMLFLIPFTLIFVPIFVWLCYLKNEKKNIVILTDQNIQLLKPASAVSGLGELGRTV